jgi:hypothetical protein
MKVNRQNLSEEYSTTAGWVRDFSNGLSKNADYLNNLRSIMNKRKDFDTIEEKMADLRTRAGFDLIKDVNIKKEVPIKSAGCGCNSCEGCSSDTGKASDKKELAKDLKVVMKYIASLIEDRPEAGYGAILTHCRQHPHLGFDRLERRLNSKFKKAVLSMLKEHKNDPEAVEYISGADMTSSNDDDIADYYSHANG